VEKTGKKKKMGKCRFRWNLNKLKEVVRNRFVEKCCDDLEEWGKVDRTL
jgi:hypothetical protein